MDQSPKPTQNSALPDPGARDASLSEEAGEAAPPPVTITRASVKALLVEMTEVATARKPLKVTLAISRNVDGKKIRIQKSVEILARDRRGVTDILKLLGRELAMFKGESALPPASLNFGSREHVAALLAKYYGLSPAQIEKLAKDKQAAEEKLSKDKQAGEADGH